MLLALASKVGEHAKILQENLVLSTQKDFGFALVAFSFGVYLSKNVCIKDRNSWLMDLKHNVPPH